EVGVVAAEELVVAAAAVDVVVPAAPVDDVLAGARADDVVAAVAPDLVVAVRPEDDVVAVRADEARNSRGPAVARVRAAGVAQRGRDGGGLLSILADIADLADGAARVDEAEHGDQRTVKPVRTFHEFLRARDVAPGRASSHAAGQPLFRGDRARTRPR